MGSGNTATQMSAAPLAPAPPLGAQFFAVDPTPPVLHQAAWRWATIFHWAFPAWVWIQVSVDLRLILLIAAAPDEPDADQAEFSEGGEPADPEPVNKLEDGIFAIGGGPIAPASLLGSLHGVFGHHGP